MGVNMDYLHEDPSAAVDPAQTDIRYGDPSGRGYTGLPTPVSTVVPIGGSSEGGFYDNRDDDAGGTDTHYNMVAGSDQAGADWYSAGDTTPVVNSSSGLGGERAKFSDTLSQESLAGGENTGQFTP